MEIHLHLDDRLHERLRRAAFYHRLTKAGILREALVRELNRLEQKPHPATPEKKAKEEKRK